jgi:hypothetical protein
MTGRSRGRARVRPETEGSVLPQFASTSEDSPPAQLKPKSSSASSGNKVISVGRAANRGVLHQAGTTVYKQQREIRVESVLYTRPGPKLKAGKLGKSGTPVKILCNYFQVLDKPDWVFASVSC